MMFRRLFITILVAASVFACSDGADLGGVDDAIIGALTDDGGPIVDDVDTAASEDAEEPIYPGFPCESDEECSTGKCYGDANTQGAFQPSRCQARCLPNEDFANYCNTDADCCSGRCCVGCGWREGLCISP